MTQRSKRGTAEGDNQRKLKVQKKSRGDAPANPAIKHKYVTDDELATFQKKVTSVQGELPAIKLGENDQNECVSEVMRHLLAQNQAKPDVPIPQVQISKLLKELQPSQKGIAKAILERARRRFVAFGWDLVEVGSGAGSSYVLRSFVPHQFLLDSGIIGKVELQLSSLKLIVALFMHTNGGKATAEDLQAFLRKFGVKVNLGKNVAVSAADQRKQKEMFGHENPVSLLREQRFLKCTAEKNIEGFSVDVYYFGEGQCGEAAQLTEEQLKDAVKEVMEL